MTANRLIAVGARSKARRRSQRAPLILATPSSLARGKQEVLKIFYSSEAAAGTQKRQGCV